MSQNRYQSGEEPRIGDLVKRVEGYGGMADLPIGGTYRVTNLRDDLCYRDHLGLFARRLKLIERADPGCLYKIGDVLSHAGSKRTGIVQEFKRHVHPLTKEVWYSAWVRRPNSERLKNWDLRRCSLVSPIVGVRSDTSEVVRESNLKREPEQLTYYELLTKYNTLRDLLDTVTRERDSLLEQFDQLLRIAGDTRKKRDEATQAADKLQTQLNECRDQLSLQVRASTQLADRYHKLKNRARNLLNDE